MEETEDKGLRKVCEHDSMEMDVRFELKVWKRK